MKLNVAKFGLAGGILWGVSLFFLTFVNLWFDYANMWMQLMSDIYPGFEVSPVGSVIGFAYGFLDGGIGSALFAWIYNKLVD